MTKTIFKTLILLVLMGATSCHKDEEEQTEQKTDYCSLFDYKVSLWVNNMTDEEIVLQLVYPGYNVVKVPPHDSYFATKVNALDLLKSFGVDMSDDYLQSGRIRYWISCNKTGLKLGWLSRDENLADMIITKNNKGELEVTGTSQTHLD